ncbi:MAG TPA: low molecular weight phosphatase family protein [Thermohalobaculum sp.]|nr:low molecular weight phosphatase family protein [Thermohalobaculum sp.]
MAHALPGSVLFCCDHNSIRSPFAEALMKKLHGERVFVQSAGVRHEVDVDPFMVEVAREVGVELAGHRAKSFDEMEEWGDDMGAFDMIVALSPAAQRRALEYTRLFSIEVLYWPTLNPAGIGEQREQKLAAYRQARDQIVNSIVAAFGPGEGDGEADEALDA